MRSRSLPGVGERGTVKCWLCMTMFVKESSLLVVCTVDTMDSSCVTVFESVGFVALLGGSIL